MPAGVVSKRIPKDLARVAAKATKASATRRLAEPSMEAAARAAARAAAAAAVLQSLVGRRHLFELRLSSRRVVLVAVRVVKQRQPPVRGLDLGLR